MISDQRAADPVGEVSATLTAPPDATSGWQIPTWQLVIAQLSDSALPTGAFSHSLGLETYVLDETVTDETTLTAWLTVFVLTQLACSDGYAMREACRAREAANTDEIWRLDSLLYAQALPRQVREANMAMGTRTTRIATAALSDVLLIDYLQRIEQGRCHGHPALAVALAGSALACPVPVLIACHLHAVVTNLVQNAVRAIPLGQDAGQRVLTAMRPVVEQALVRIQNLAPEDFGATSPGLELAQMRHERVRARMYMS